MVGNLLISWKHVRKVLSTWMFFKADETNAHSQQDMEHAHEALFFWLASYLGSDAC